MKEAMRGKHSVLKITAALLLCPDLERASRTGSQHDALCDWLCLPLHVFALIDAMLCPAFEKQLENDPTALAEARRASIAASKLLTSAPGQNGMMEAGPAAVARSVMRVVAAEAPADHVAVGCAVTLLGEIARAPWGGAGAISALVEGAAGEVREEKPERPSCKHVQILPLIHPSPSLPLF